MLQTEGGLMPYDPMTELKKVKDYYASDPLQKRFSALVCGGTGSGKTFLLRTARFPVHIDSFDPGGTKCLRPWIESGDVIADTRWENEDPYNPSVFKEWMRATDIRIQQGYFNIFGTYALDSLTTFGDSAMNFQLVDPLKKDGSHEKVSRAGEPPQYRKDYTPQKVHIVNRVKKLMTLPCDFFLMAHLNAVEEVTGTTRMGDPIKKTIYRLLVTGQAVVTVPLQFDELYVILGKETSSGIDRELLIDAQGKYTARSRLKSKGFLGIKEPPDVKALLKKVGLSCEDKARLEV